jgi:hypothetical protein
MLYCIQELRYTLWFIVEHWVMCIDNECVLREEQEEEDFIKKMTR